MDFIFSMIHLNAFPGTDLKTSISGDVDEKVECLFNLINLVNMPISICV